MKKDDYVFIEHILSCIKKIQMFCKDVKKEEFNKSEIIQDAVIRNIEVIGEAVKNISSDFRKRHQHIEWKDIAGMRDKLMHHYVEKFQKTTH